MFSTWPHSSQGFSQGPAGMRRQARWRGGGRNVRITLPRPLRPSRTQACTQQLQDWRFRIVEVCLEVCRALNHCTTLLFQGSLFVTPLPATRLISSQHGLCLLKASLYAGKHPNLRVAIPASMSLGLSCLLFIQSLLRHKLRKHIQRPAAQGRSDAPRTSPPQSSGQVKGWGQRCCGSSAVW